MAFSLLVASVALAAPSVAETRGADAPARERRDVAWDAWGEARARGESGSLPPSEAGGAAPGPVSSRVIAAPDPLFTIISRSGTYGRSGWGCLGWPGHIRR